MTSSNLRTSGIWDNHHRRSIGDFLKEKILQGSDLSFVSAYLLYIRDDGTVRFTFTQAKNALSMFQKLSVGKAAPYQALCDLFDRETENGAKMGKYSDLLAYPPSNPPSNSVAERVERGRS